MNVGILFCINTSLKEVAKKLYRYNSDANDDFRYVTITIEVTNEAY